MKVILLGEIKGKGGEGDVIDVAQGYAENYLFPKKLAVAATKGNLKQLEERRNNIAKREAVRMADANALKETLEGKQVTVDAKVGDEGILFGSVTAAMIADAVKDQLNVEIDASASSSASRSRSPAPTRSTSRSTARCVPPLRCSWAWTPRRPLRRPRLRLRPRPRLPRLPRRLLSNHRLPAPILRDERGCSFEAAAPFFVS